MLFCDYYEGWVADYKENVVADTTLAKYRMTGKWLRKLAPDLQLVDLDRRSYQSIINGYGACHERATVKDFNTQIKACVLDAVDEGLVPVDPTRKVVIKAQQPRENKKKKFLSKAELSAVLKALDLNKDGEIGVDWVIFLIAKTGLRYAEALGLTPADFDFENRILNITKTWDYKKNTGFAPTKNFSSVRKIEFDWQTAALFMARLNGMPEDKPIFVPANKRVHNSTINNRLTKLCRQCDAPEITVHGLRHTHASLLLFAGVSVASVAKRLGHSSMSTTQNVYLHIVDELANKDSDTAIGFLSVL